MGERKFSVSSSPHIRHEETVPKIMWTVFAVLALITVFGGLRVFCRDAAGNFYPWPIFVVVISVATAIGVEALILAIRKKPVKRALDGSAAVTGILFAMVISPAVPWYVVFFGALVAVAVGKQLFGGLGYNIWNPALVGRAFALMAWSAPMTRYWPDIFAGTPYPATDATITNALSAATPLTAAKMGKPAAVSISDLFWGNVSGSLGETCAFLLLVGGIVMIILKYIDWRVPVVYIATAVILCMLIPYGGNAKPAEWIKNMPWYEEMAFWAFSGGLFLGAFFMATDMVTTPITAKGRVIFALGCGILTAVIRKLGGYPEGVCYSILIMNTCVPLIDRFVKPRRFGTVTFYTPPQTAQAASKSK